MKKTLYIAGWYLFLIGTFFYGISIYKTPRFEDIPLGPQQTYEWHGVTSATYIIGDGETEIHVKNLGSNFTILDENDYFVATGHPDPLLPGETDETYTAKFKAENGKRYRVDSNVIVYTLEPTTMKFQFVVMGGFLLSVFAVMFAFITFLILAEMAIHSVNSRHNAW